MENLILNNVLENVWRATDNYNKDGEYNKYFLAIMDLEEGFEEELHFYLIYNVKVLDRELVIEDLARNIEIVDKDNVSILLNALNFKEKVRGCYLDKSRKNIAIELFGDRYKIEVL